MRRGVSGNFTVGFGGLFRPFVPYDLPPELPVEISSARQCLLERAMASLCRLDTIGLPHYLFILREAVVSMRLHGSQSSLTDLLLLDSDPASDYVVALEYGLSRIRRGSPLSNGLIREMHRILMARAWRSVTPGEFRGLQTWVGGTLAENARFVPPPPSHVQGCMSALEQFIQAPCLPLIKAALVHVQFRTIHPFFRGSSRIGRMLIPLMTHPLLHLSPYIRGRQPEYHRLLDLVRAEGDWESWLDFFLEGAVEAASYTVSTARQLAALFKDDARRVSGIGRGASRALKLHRALCERPITSLTGLSQRTGLLFPTTANGVDRLEKLGIVREITGERRNRVFAYDRCMEILDC